MAPPKPLKPGALRRRCKKSVLRFKTTDQLPDLDEVIGQPRAMAALDFGFGIRQPGFNLFAYGPPDTDMHTIIVEALKRRAAEEPTPEDRVYVHNFDRPRKPNAIALPPGRGAAFRDDMAKLVEELGSAIPAAFESDEYRQRRQVIEEEVGDRQKTALGEIETRAAQHDIALVRTPLGMGFAPVRDGKVIEPPVFAKMPHEERETITKAIAGMQEELQTVVGQFPQWQREAREKIKTLNREWTAYAVGHLFAELRAKHTDIDEIAGFIDQVRDDVIENAELFLPTEPNPAQAVARPGGGPDRPGRSPLSRYQVNLLVDHTDNHGAPVVYEPHPTYQNLVGRVEHTSELGAVFTDFTLIQPGALHRANGGYLIVDANRLLAQTYAWDGLKQALRAKQIRIESLGQVFSMVSTQTLEPEDIPLEVKVVMLGDPMLYYLFGAHDRDFGDLFKVPVDFDDRTTRDDQTTMLYARSIATQARRCNLRPFERDAVALIIDETARLAGDNDRLSTRTRAVSDLLQEAHYRAGLRDAAVVGAADVQSAIDAAIYRSDRIRERMLEETTRGTILIDTHGTEVGQINGLAVTQLGGFAFGRPNRITVRIRIGRGEVIDIEREVKLGGALHSKGVLILSNFLAARYAVDQPLSLSASLVFEQSYGGVDGDSASSAELYALLSALSDVPIRQGFAVTGSVNQLGEVQAIGGVNEKIEGFYDLCRARGLTGDQGVMIPQANIKHLMLRPDVVAAAEAGQFQVIAVETIDQGIEILTGLPAGAPRTDGRYPDGSINRRVADRLGDFAAKRRSFGTPNQNQKQGNQ